MSIEGLVLRTGDISISYGQSIVMSKRWEAYHPLAIVDSGTVSRRVANLQQIADADLELQAMCESRFSSAIAYHEPRGVIGGLSAFDADLVLDRWMQSEDGLDHPVLGHIDASSESLVRRINIILEHHAPPPPPGSGRKRTAGQSECGAPLLRGLIPIMFTTGMKSLAMCRVQDGITSLLPVAFILCVRRRLSMGWLASSPSL